MIMDRIPVGDPKQRRHRRGRWSGLLVRLRRWAHRLLLLGILLANVQFLDNKVDKIRARVAFQRYIRYCNILCFMETWLTRDMLSVQPPGFFMRRVDRNKHLSGKKDRGVCFMINDYHNIQELNYFCSHDLEFFTIKCRPYYLPRVFSSVIVTAVYIPPQADTTTAIKELHWILCKLETIYPEAALIVAGDFNKANFENKAT